MIIAVTRVCKCPRASELRVGTVEGMKMQIERERRFLCTAIPEGSTRVGCLHQAYVIASRFVELRVRSGAEHSAAIKIGVGGAARFEFESALPAILARRIVRLTPLRVEKTRYVLDVTGADGTTRRWDIDCYRGRHEGLITAEVEHAAGDRLETPDWVGDDVTGVERYTNRSLARR